jgi:hypothetical protein
MGIDHDPALRGLAENLSRRAWLNNRTRRLRPPARQLEAWRCLAHLLEHAAPAAETALEAPDHAKRSTGRTDESRQAERIGQRHMRILGGEHVTVGAVVVHPVAEKRPLLDAGLIKSRMPSVMS